MPETTTLPIPPAVAAVLALLVLTWALFGLLLLQGRDRPAPRWEGMSAGWLALAVVGALVWIALFLMILAAVFNGLIGAMEEPEATSLGLGGLLVALLGAPFLIWTTVLKHRTVEFQKEGHMTDRISKAVEQLGAEKTVKKIVDGQSVETSEPNLEVRIGAILSLERIAQDSTIHDKGRDHVRVMEILCAYIRHNAPASSAQDHPFGEWEPLKDNPTLEERTTHEARREERFGGEGQVRAWAKTLSPPRADIAEALKVIGRRSRDQLLVEAAWPHPRDGLTNWPFDNAPHLPDEPGDSPLDPAVLDDFKARLGAWKQALDDFPGHRLDLRGTNLQGADLSGHWLQGARLGGAWLEGAHLWEARLEGADLGGARLEGALLGGARLEGAYLGRARLEGANLGQARLEGAYLGWARLEGADLGGARLEGADLLGARLEGAHLGGARLEGADLGEARLEGAYLGQALLEGAYLGGALLEGADLGQARLEGANLGEARLEGVNLWLARVDAGTCFTGATTQHAAAKDVDLSMVKLSDTQVKSIFGDASVILPGGVTPGHSDWPAHWPVWELDVETFHDEYHKWRENPAAYRPPPPPDSSTPDPLDAPRPLRYPRA